VSKARPRVADYPFTTLHPHVGALAYADGFSATMADIPGLVEGAHGDAGMGHQFLRHVERTRVLLYVIDAAGKDPVGDLQALQLELRLFKAELPARPSLVVANKMDLVVEGGAGAASVEALRDASPMPVFPVSTVTKAGLPALLQAIRWFCERGVDAGAALGAGGGSKK
jgi:GTP-binding protein